MLKDIAGEAATIKLGAQGVSGASAATLGWMAAAGEWSVQLFGIPLPVLLCAAIGAFGVLSFMEVRSVRRAIASSVAAMMVAAICAPLALHAAGDSGKPLPGALAPGMAILLAVVLQLVLPWAFENTGRILSEGWTRLLDRFAGPRPPSPPGGLGGGAKQPPASPPAGPPGPSGAASNKPGEGGINAG